jgi:hypothetical protein
MSKPLTPERLRKTNIYAGVLHLAQMAAVLALSSDFSLPVTATYMSGPPGTTYADPIVLFNTPIGLTVAIFLGLSAFFHFRWVEYSISSSVMIVLIAQVTGVADITAIISIFGVNASMILFGWLQEKYEDPGNGGWLPYIFGCITGIVPWLALMFYVFGIGGAGETKAPAFVYVIVLTIFLFFNSFALVQFLQYKKVGKWSDYLRGEATYITLSLVAKSALSWQIFANTLIPPA